LERRRLAKPRQVKRDHVALRDQRREHRVPHVPVGAERVQQDERRSAPGAVEGDLHRGRITIQRRTLMAMSLLNTARMYVKRTPKLDESTDVYDHKVGLLDGGELDLESLRGRPTLIINTASKCGFTPQYEGLQKLYETYSERGLQMLGTPSGDFADQEFEEASEIGEFCQKNYGVSFPLTERMSVRADPDPLWSDLIRQPESAPPAWNFNKYLVDGDGKLIAHWGSKVTPDDPKIVAAIEAALPVSD
jgi:glutathione peroxidase